MSSSIIQMLASQLDERTIKQISTQLGADDQTTQQAISTAIPMLLGALDRNTNTADGAQALTNALQRDHDGSILNDAPNAVTRPETRQDGQAILNHVLGAKQNNVEMGISKTTGLDMSSTGQLMQMVAPLVLGALGQMQQQQNLDAGQVSSLLSKERQETESSLSGLAKILDMDGDGDVTDDLIGLGSNLLGGFFGSKR